MSIVCCQGWSGIPTAVYAVPPEEEQVVLETWRLLIHNELNTKSAT
jgi:hypothetical protein